MLTKYRIELLDKKELELLEKLIRREIETNTPNIYAKRVLEAIQNVKHIKWSKKKYDATVKANESKIRTSRKKVDNAINLLRKEGKKITTYSIAKTAGISFNTAQKYYRMLNNS